MIPSNHLTDIGYHKFVTANGCTISYDDAGTGEIPIIFIHGFPFDKSTWKPQLDFLKNSNRVLAIDVRSFGKSTSGKDVKSISLYATDLIKFMDALQIKQAVVCGLSMGGYILLNAISRYADRFKAIILCDTQCIADTDDSKKNRLIAIEQIKADGLQKFADNFISKIFCRETLNNKKDLVERIRTLIMTNKIEAVTEGLIVLSDRWEMCKTLEDIRVPTLIICGREDLITPLQESEFLHRNIVQSKLHVLDHAGHLTNLEQPEKYNLYLQEFLQQQA